MFKKIGQFTLLAVLWLLAGRAISSQSCLWVHKVTATRNHSSGLAVHAWLQCDDLIVNGGTGHQGFTVVPNLRWGRS